VNAAIGFGDDRVSGPVAQVSRRVGAGAAVDAVGAAAAIDQVVPGPAAEGVVAAGRPGGMLQGGKIRCVEDQRAAPDHGGLAGLRLRAAFVDRVVRRQAGAVDLDMIDPEIAVLGSRAARSIVDVLDPDLRGGG
jgi:hypothetical protein